MRVARLIRQFEAHWDPCQPRPLASTIFRGLRSDVLLPLLPAAFMGAMLGLQPLLCVRDSRLFLIRLASTALSIS